MAAVQQGAFVLGGHCHIALYVPCLDRLITIVLYLRMSATADGKTEFGENARCGLPNANCPWGT